MKIDLSKKILETQTRIVQADADSFMLEVTGPDFDSVLGEAWETVEQAKADGNSATATRRYPKAMRNGSFSLSLIIVYSDRLEQLSEM